MLSKGLLFLVKPNLTKMTKNLYLLAAFLMLAFSNNIWAQKKKAPIATPPIPSVNTFDAKIYAGIKWRNIGPFRGGRSNAVSGVIQNENLYYCG